MSDEQTVKAEAAKAWRCALEDVFADDVTAEFPWVQNHTLFYVMNREREGMLVSLDEDGSASVFHGPAAARLEALNRLLYAENVFLPDRFSAVQLADLTHDFLGEPGGFVGCAEFWEEQKDSLKLWTAPSPEAGAELFKQCCRGPELEREVHQWTLRFFLFNHRGGVEAWLVSGNLRVIQEASSEGVLPPGTFSPPYG